MWKVDTFDSIIAPLNIDVSRVRHVNITNNGAEYHTLMGMTNFLTSAKNISIALTCGRIGVMGIVDDRPDQDLILERFQKLGFESKFYRIKDLFWWGFYKKLLIKRKWMYSSKPHFGVVLAHKGNQPLKFASFIYVISLLLKTENTCLILDLEFNSSKSTFYA